MREKNRKPEAPEHSYVKLCLLQTVLVLIAGTVIYLAFRLNPPLYQNIKDSFINYMSGDFDAGGYFSSFSDKKEEKINTASSVNHIKTESKITPCYAVSSTDIPADGGIFAVYSAAVIMPAKGVVSSDYGYRMHPINKQRSFHGGRDIAGEEGSGIYAALDGTVTEAGKAEMAGNYIKIDHGGGKETLYCHCRELYVTAGMKVRKGDRIASMGHTGLATGPHLHFEYRVDGRHQNPSVILDHAVNAY